LSPKINLFISLIPFRFTVECFVFERVTPNIATNGLGIAEGGGF